MRIKNPREKMPTRNNKNGFWLRYTNVFRRYEDILRSNWILILSFGFFYAWFIVFPLQGPLLDGLARNGPFFQMLTLFLIGNILGLVFFGILGYLFRGIQPFLTLGALPCAFLTFTIKNITMVAWPYIFFGLGFFSAMAIICWATAFGKSILPSQRGSTLAIGMAVAYLIFYVMNWLVQWATLQSLLISIALILSAFPVLLNYWHRKAVSTPTSTYNPEKMRLASYWPLLPFLFGVYAVSGLIHSVIFPIWSLTGHQSELLHVIFGVLPQIGFIFVAGILADIRGRRIDALIGAIMIGAGFMLYSLLSGVFQDISTHVFVIGGFAFLDIFIWTVLADISKTRSVSLYYGIGLGLNIFAIFLGILLGERVTTLTGGTKIMIIELAGLLSFLSLAVIPALSETLRHGQALVPQRTAEYLITFFDEARFTRREVDVAKLLATGASTEEIQHRLVIAPDTLKRHLRNIYGKVGVKNRLELTLLMINELQKGD